MVGYNCLISILVHVVNLNIYPHRPTPDPSLNEAKALATSSTQNIDTSGDPGLPGAYADTYITPALSIVISKTGVVTFDAGTCTGAMQVQSTWNIESDNSNTIVFKQDWDIRSRLVPDLIQRITDMRLPSKDADGNDIAAACGEMEAVGKGIDWAGTHKLANKTGCEQVGRQRDLV